MSNPQHSPTNDLRVRVKAYSAYGIPQENIARLIKISLPTLHKYYREELDTGMDEANAAVAQSLFRSATKGSVAAMCFWMKTRAGWRETNRTEITGKDGSPLSGNIFNTANLQNMTEDELITLQELLQKAGQSS